MVNVTKEDLQEIVERVRHWPAAARADLARNVLRTIGPSAGEKETPGVTYVSKSGRGLSIAANALEDPGSPWRELIQHLDEFAVLEQNWDGNGAEPPAKEVIATARRWLWAMPSLHLAATPPEAIVPGVSGDLVLVWRHQGLQLEATLESAGQVSWMEVLDGSVRHFETSPEVAVIIE